MPDYTLRNVKGSELTFNELDNNFVASRTTARLNCNAVVTPSSGVYVNQSLKGGAMDTETSVTNQIVLTPFVLAYDLTIDQVGVFQTSTGTTDLRILIYSSNASGQPDSKLYESTTITTANGENTQAATHTFTANVLYWVGTHTSGGKTFRSVPPTGLLPLGIGTGLNTTAISHAVVLGSTAIGSAPATWSFATSQLGSSTNGVISVGFRAS